MKYLKDVRNVFMFKFNTYVVNVMFFMLRIGEKMNDR